MSQREVRSQNEREGLTRAGPQEMFIGFHYYHWFFGPDIWFKKKKSEKQGSLSSFFIVPSSSPVITRAPVACISVQRLSVHTGSIYRVNAEGSGQSQELKAASPRENEKPSTTVPLCQLRHPCRVHPGEQRATELVMSPNPAWHFMPHLAH